MEYFIADRLTQNTLQSNILPTTDGKILTLSTCTGVIQTNRWVVQAVLEGQVVSNPEVPIRSEHNTP